MSKTNDAMKLLRLIAIRSLFAVLIQMPVLNAQDQGYIYARVTTTDNQEYLGPIRWGKEEVLWTDLFNAAKPENDNLRYLSREEVRSLEDRRNGRSDWGDRFVNWVSHEWSDRDFTHQFVCQFGEIKSIRPTWRDKAEIELRNGTKVEVDGEGYNDLGGFVRVLDKELGQIDVNWRNIEKIDFMTTPSTLKEKFAEGLYGTVKSSRGSFTGFIAWDNDERLLIDKLDGETSDGKVSIEFSKIASIEQSWNEATVELQSGRKLIICCSNDVNRENRGIIVDDPSVGKIEIPWKEFEKVSFSRPGNMRGYDAFKTQKEIEGTVVTKEGKSLTGKIIYDLDEEYDYEVLQGKDDDVEYFIPFRNIKRIKPSGWRGATIELANGRSVSLEESQDVSELHQGLLVFNNGKSDPSYVRWEDIEEIKINSN
jgi:hypothetical protein